MARPNLCLTIKKNLARFTPKQFLYIYFDLKKQTRFIITIMAEKKTNQIRAALPQRNLSKLYLLNFKWAMQINQLSIAGIVSFLLFISLKQTANCYARKDHIVAEPLVMNWLHAMQFDSISVQFIWLILFLKQKLNFSYKLFSFICCFCGTLKQ